VNVALAAVAAVALVVEGMVRAKGGLSPAAYVLAIAASAPLAWGERAPLSVGPGDGDGWRVHAVLPLRSDRR
jgi:hypothetical protein